VSPVERVTRAYFVPAGGPHPNCLSNLLVSDLFFIKQELLPVIDRAKKS
jgi:hypothetical protein